MAKISERLYISAGMAVSAWGQQRAAFNRAWFYWRPHAHWNKGLPFSNRVCSFGASWLCFFFSCDFWPTWVHKVNQGTAQEIKHDG